MSHHSLTRLLCSLVVLSLCFFPIHMQAGGELEQHLNDRYKARTLLLRNFYAGGSLQYDASGQLSRIATPGDWTVDGFFQVDEVKVSKTGLTIQGKRVRLGWVRSVGFSVLPDPEGNAGKGYQETRKLKIEVDLKPGGVSAEHAGAVLARIFLTSQDHFVELVPDYWKPCVAVAVTGKDSRQYGGCRFSGEFLAVPGVGPSPNEGAESAPTEDAALALSNRAGKITPATAVSTPGPEFSEEARRANYRGSAVVSVVVDRTGQVRIIRIVRPLGMGLDQKAVEAVSAWQFHPATQNGEPIESGINVEVDFQRY